MASQQDVLKGPHEYKAGVYYPVASTASEYPKWVGPVLVQTKAEEDALQPKKEESKKESKRPEYK